MGEIHAARIVGALACTQPAVFRTAQPHYIVRIAVGVIILALRKFDDLWICQISTRILPADKLPAEGTALHRTLEQKKFRAFCNRVVAHYAQEPVDPKTSPERIEELLRDQGFESDLDFFKWTS